MHCAPQTQIPRDSCYEILLLTVVKGFSKDLVSVRTVQAIHWKKIVIHLNGTGYPFEIGISSLRTTIHSRKIVIRSRSNGSDCPVEKIVIRSNGSSYLLKTIVIRATVPNRRGGRGGGGLLPIHSLKWNPDDVLTTCKAISKGLASGFVTDHAHYVKNHRLTVLRRNKNIAAQGGNVSHYYILVIRNFLGLMSLLRHRMWFSFSVKQFSSGEFGILCNI